MTSIRPLEYQLCYCSSVKIAGLSLVEATANICNKSFRLACNL